MRELKAFGKRTELANGAHDWKFESRPGGWWIATHGTTGERKRLQLVSRGGRVAFSLDGVLWHGEVLDRAAGGGAGAATDFDFTAQFPGKVRKIVVKAGAAVAEGDPLLLMEAMKMEFTLRAPAAGRVDKLLVQEGQQLSPGDILLEFTPAGGKG